MIDFKIELPVGKFKDRLCGVYRMDFDNGLFYIGSSTHLRRRANAWKNAITSMDKGDIVAVNKLWGSILNRIEGVKAVLFTVVRFTSIDELKEAEEVCMCSFRGNDFMINKILHPSNGVIVKNADGNEICRYKSLIEASRQLNLFTRRIQDVCNGYVRICRGMKFEWENKSLRATPKPKKKKQKPIKVLKYNLNGEFIQGYVTTMAAARDAGINKKGVYSVMKGKQKTAGGYIFKKA